jgi:hypothetical protein
VIDTPGRLLCNRLEIAEHAPAEPVDDGGQIDKAARHRDIGDVHRPDLVGTIDLQSAQEIGIDPVARRGFRGVRPAIDRLDAHALHQRGDVAAADLDARAVEKVAQHPAARERIFQMQFVDAAHQREVLGRHRPRLVVDAAAADVQSLGLADDGKVVVAVDHLKAIARQSSGFTLSMPALMSAPSKKLSAARRASCGIETGSR